MQQVHIEFLDPMKTDHSLATATDSLQIINVKVSYSNKNYGKLRTFYARLSSIPDQINYLKIYSE